MVHAYPRDLAAFALRRWEELEAQANPGPCTPREGALPPLAALETLISVAYQASLLQEEGRPVKFRLFVGDPGALSIDGGPPHGLHRLRFEKSRPYDDHEIQRLAPAAKYHRSLIGVRLAEAQRFEIWGVLQSGPRWLQSARGGRMLPSPVPSDAVVIRVPGPGRIAVSLGDVTLAEIRGGQLLVDSMDVFEGALLRSRFAHLRAGLIAEHERAMRGVSGAPLDPNVAGVVTVQMLKRLVSTIREAHNGGTILFIPREHTRRLIEEERSLRIKYAFSDEEPRRRYRTLILAVLRELSVTGAELDPLPAGVGWSTYQGSARPAIAALDEAILEMSQLLAGLSDVDGAVVLTEYFEVLGFGAEIGGNLPDVTVVRKARDLVDRDFKTLEVDGVGTRHRSAYRICAHEHGAMAIVVSHDGGVQFVAWHDGAPTFWEHVPAVGAEM
ncbi:MAG TPA: hypothetical protein VK841_23100 [Polyangiaceae bacterium]|jgi:hypothetical protein|nr:hypothetical protein [Polyangiaceae bacterium]